MPAPPPIAIGAVLNKVEMIVNVGESVFTVVLPLADAERAMGQLAIAIVQARAARREAEHLDRR